MNDNREFCIRTAKEMLTELRGFQFKTLLNEQTNYVCGYLAGLMHAGAIDRKEFSRLCELAGNAGKYRTEELDRVRRAAA